MIATKTLKISAVIPAYNAEKHIARAISSVLNQSTPVDEILVVDDGSTDKTADVVKGYGDAVRYIYQANAGASAARNAGIEAATGDWIAFLDGDDEWTPDKIKLQTGLLSRNPDLVWTSGNYINCLCNENRRAEHSLEKDCLERLGGNEVFESFFNVIQFEPWGCMDCMLIRKDVLEQVGMFRVGQLKANDIDLWLRIAYRYPRIGFSPEPLAIYHLSVENSIGKKYRKTRLYTEFMTRHFEIAAREGALESFRPAAAFFMKGWIRRMLFEGRKAEIHDLLASFPESFSPLYRGIVKGLTVYPDLTAYALHLISKTVRAFNLRRRVILRPASPKD